jgi:uncharacterized LabA/DUF88 family protein
MKRLGWSLDYRKLRIYLKEKYGTERAYMFIGFIASNWELYVRLAAAGFILIFKPVTTDINGKAKGNIDADLVLKAMIEYRAYSRAVIISSDGDFYSLVDHLYQKNKLEIVLSPHMRRCSYLLKEKAREKIWFLDGLRGKLEYTDTKKGSA